MGHLCIHGVELGSTVGAGEQQLLGVPGPHVLGKVTKENVLSFIVEENGFNDKFDKL